MIAVEAAIERHLEVISALRQMIPSISTVAERMTKCLESGGTIYWMGNGGSASDSQHLAAELVGRYTRERRGLASVALTTDTSILTAVGNDYGFDSIFVRQVEALCAAGDVVVGISTSGNSKNVVLGIEAAKRGGCYTLGLAGRDGGKLASAAEMCLTVSCDETARIQEAHILIGHILCDWIEASVVQPAQTTTT